MLTRSLRTRTQVMQELYVTLTSMVNLPILLGSAIRYINQGLWSENAVQRGLAGGAGVVGHAGRQAKPSSLNSYPACKAFWMARTSAVRLAFGALFHFTSTKYGPSWNLIVCASVRARCTASNAFAFA